jgi:hypothetical protein
MKENTGLRKPKCHAVSCSSQRQHGARARARSVDLRGANAGSVSVATIMKWQPNGDERMPLRFCYGLPVHDTSLRRENDNTRGQALSGKLKPYFGGWSDGIRFVLCRNREFNESGSPQPPPSWESRERGNLRRYLHQQLSDNCVGDGNFVDMAPL